MTRNLGLLLVGQYNAPYGHLHIVGKKRTGTLSMGLGQTALSLCKYLGIITKNNDIYCMK